VKLDRRAFVLGLGGLCLSPALRAQDYDVDLALVLAVDCSFSVDSNEFRLQMEGLGKAFMSADVKAAIRRGATGRIAVTAVQWSDEINQLVIVPWTVISGDADADEIGAILFNMPRKLAEGGTSISAALRFSGALFATAPTSERRVIDVSSDGRNNIGIPVTAMRDHLVGQGITINALAILNDWPTLDVYFERNVVGGQAHFVISANDYAAYEEAIYRKLLREITGPGIS
jgi:Protein of unknown function (DUF1194)